MTNNDSIEIVKRNLINIFEDLEDPLLAEDDPMSPNPNKSMRSTV